MLIVGPSFHLLAGAIGVNSTVLVGGIPGAGFGRVTGIELEVEPPGLSEEGATDDGGEGPGGPCDPVELGVPADPRIPAANSFR